MAFSAVTERGSNTEKTSDTSLGVSPSAAVAVGKIVFAILAFDNIGTTDGATTTNDTLTDTDGHTWTKVAERSNSSGSADDGVTGALWWTKVVIEIGTGDTVTFGTDSAVTAKVIGLFEVVIGAGNTIQLAGSAFGVTDSGNYPVLTISGLVSKEYFWLGVAWREQSIVTAPTWTQESGYTNVFAADAIGTSGAPAGSNVLAHAAYLIATATGDTFDATLTGSVETAAAFFAFEELTGVQVVTVRQLNDGIQSGDTVVIDETGHASALDLLNFKADRHDTAGWVVVWTNPDIAFTATITKGTVLGERVVTRYFAIVAA